MSKTAALYMVGVLAVLALVVALFLDHTGVAEIPVVRPVSALIRGDADSSVADGLAAAADEVPGGEGVAEKTRAAAASRRAGQLGEVVLAQRAEVRGCEREGPVPEERGERLVLVVSAAGNVVETSWDGEKGDSGFAKCVTQQAKSWRFPEATGPDVTVEVPPVALTRMRYR